MLKIEILQDDYSLSTSNSGEKQVMQFVMPIPILNN